MPRIATLYMDDSGTRHPDHAGTPTPQGYDWFALGGIHVREEDELRCRDQHATFCERWNLHKPLHSVKIRCQQGHFAWLGKVEPSRRIEFLQNLGQILTMLPVLGMACVIDRPGYNKRYQERYGQDRWRLCRTAFSIVVERAAKFAASEGRRLNVAVERSDRRTDRDIRSYFQSMKTKGMPFAATNSTKYSPLKASELSSTLYDLRMKYKTSPMIQYADLYLYPICRGRYEPSYRPYRALTDAKRLIDAQLNSDARETLGIKYSCFDFESNPPKKG